MSRLHRPSPQELTEPQRAVYDDIVAGDRGADGAFEMVDNLGRLNGPYNAMIVAPQIGGPLGQLGAALRFHGRLSARAREIAILAVATAKQSRFELFAHTRVARTAGLTDAEVGDLTAGRRPASLTPVEAAVLDLVQHLLADRAVPDDEYERFRSVLGEAGIVEVATLVGYYSMLAVQLSLFEVEVPAGDTPS